MRVLIVEDDPDFVALVEAYVEELAGITTTAVGTWEAAKARLDEHDVVLLDLHLPDSPWTRSIENIRTIDPGVAVIVMSSYLTPEDEIAPLLAGAQEVLLKDEITPQTLDRSFRRAVARQQTLPATDAETEQQSHARALVAEELRRLSSGLPAGRGLSARSAPDRLPDVLSSLIKEYERLLDAVVAAQTYRDSAQPTRDVRAYAARLVTLRFGPREVTEVHGAVFRHKLSGSTDDLSTLITSEGRLLLVEVMGHMVKDYRAKSVITGRPALQPGVQV